MILQLVLIATLFLAAAWRTWSWRRSAPGTRQAGTWLAVGLYVLALGQVLSFPAITASVDKITTAGGGKTAYNVATMLGLFVLLHFFASATAGGHQASTLKRALRRQAFIFAAASAALTALMIGTAPDQRAHSLHSPALAEPPVAFFYIVGNVYFIYAYCLIARLVWRYAADQAASLSRLMVLSLRIMAVAACGQALTALTRGVWVLNVFRGGPRLQRYEIINWNISNVSLILFVVGVSLLGLAQLIRAVAVFRLRRRQYRELEALWTELRQAHPELVLGDRIGNRLQRRIIECFDGLARMSPYIGVAANRADISTCTEAELAVYLRQALALKAELDRRPEDMAPVALPVAAPQDATGADVNLLVSLARAFRSQQPTARAA